MGQATVAVQPDFSAHIPPTAAKGVILTEIFAGLPVDEGIEQGIEVFAGTFARRGGQQPGKLGFRIGGDHIQDDRAANQLEPAPGIAGGGKVPVPFGLGSAHEGSHVIERPLRQRLGPTGAAVGHLVPIQGFDGIQSGGKLLVGIQQTQELLDFKADIRIDEQQMGGRFVIQKRPHQGGAGTGHQTVIAQHGQGGAEAKTGGRLDQFQHRRHVTLRHHAAETGRGDHDQGSGAHLSSGKQFSCRKASLTAMAALIPTFSDRSPGIMGMRMRSCARAAISSGTPALSRPTMMASPG